MNADIRYSIVIPVYNEEAVIDQTYRQKSAEKGGGMKGASNRWV